MPQHEIEDGRLGDNQESIAELQAVLDARSSIPEDFIATPEDLEAFLNAEASLQHIELCGFDGIELDASGMPIDPTVRTIVVGKSQLPNSLFLAAKLRPEKTIAHSGRRPMIDVNHADLKKLMASPKAAQVLSAEINKVKSAEKAAVANEAWWLNFDDQDYQENPFNKPMTEQIVFGEGDHEVVLHNFEADLTAEEVAMIAHAIRELAIMTNGLIYEIMPNIVIHSQFKEQDFLVDGRHEEPLGMAHADSGFISLNRKVLSMTLDRDYMPDAAHGQVGPLILFHEAGHVVDSYIKQLLSSGGEHLSSSFDRYFSYTDRGEAGADIAPKPEMVEDLFWQDQIEASAPTRAYGRTNSAEDFAVAFENLMIDDQTDLDPLRREALLELLRYATGGEAVAEPIRYVEDGERTSVESAVPAVPMQRRTGEQIEYPHVDASKLSKATRAVVLINTLN